MRCWRARRLATSRTEAPLPHSDMNRLDEHLARCARCAETAAGVERVWRALGGLQEVEPSAQFAARVRARIASGEPEPALPGQVVPGWQWIALASTLVVSLLVASQWRPAFYTAPESEVAGLSRADFADDRLLREVDASLSRLSADYLPAQETWPSSLLDPSFQERPSAP